VTLFGESAGGLSVLAQLVSQGARGAVPPGHRGSGTYDLAQPTLASAESSGAAFAAKVGCDSNTAANTEACLRRLPVSTILDTEDTGGYYPNIDSAVLPQSIGTALATGQFSHAPVIIGTNHDEWRSFIGQDELYGAPPVTAASFRPAAGALAPLERAMDRGLISARGADRIIRMSWTLADLAAESRPGLAEISSAPGLWLGAGQ
jgi:para-nitrobenzyl esterase